MLEQTFSINNAWSIDPPCYVRKVDRVRHCQDAATIRDNVFCPEPDDNTISVYVVETALDLARVAVALNANRSSKTEPIYLIAVAGSELGGMIPAQTKGGTLCDWANHLHRDLHVRDATQVGCLAEALVDVGRRPHKFTEKAMREALEVTAKDGCLAAVEDSAGCVCSDELPKSSLPSWPARLC